jgi:hypothetical protein
MCIFCLETGNDDFGMVLCLQTAKEYFKSNVQNSWQKWMKVDGVSRVHILVCCMGVSRVHLYGEEIVMGFLPCAHKGVHDLLFSQPHQVDHWHTIAWMESPKTQKSSFTVGGKYARPALHLFHTAQKLLPVILFLFIQQ